GRWPRPQGTVWSRPGARASRSLHHEGVRGPSQQISTPLTTRLRRVVGRIDRDRPVDDALLQFVDLRLQRLRDLAIPIVVRSEIEAFVLDRADVHATLERAVDYSCGGVFGGGVDPLHHAGDEEAAELGR